MRWLFLAVLVEVTSGGAFGQDQPAVQALRTAEGPHVDGLLDEAEWAAAIPISDFRQRDPREGAPASEATEVRVLFDRETLFIGVLARDREPAGVIGRILERDTLMEASGDNSYRFAGDDAVAVILDPFQDHRNAFLFATNPNGAEFDALITDESAAFNADWRGLWRVGARRIPEGWSAEFAIPFRTLRYPGGLGARPWGFNVERVIRRKNEDTFWKAWSRAEGGLHRVSGAGRIEGLHDLPRSGFNLEIKPYGLAGMTQEGALDGQQGPMNGQWRLGGDLKWEVRPGLVLDATVKPDFAQVEADAQAVNLTRFELYFPEKREFFLENAGIFDFGTRGAYETPPFLMFFSRRIGIADEGEVPVLGGVRLSGRAGRQTLGFLSVLTDPAFGQPRTGFSALRFKRDVGARGYVGGMLTDRRWSQAAATDLGLDASLWPTRKLNLQAFAVGTSDPAGRRDSAYRVAGDYRGDSLYLTGEYLQIGRHASTAMGFVTRTDMRRSSGKVEYTLRPTALGLQWVALFAGGKYLTRVDGTEQDGNGFSGVSAGWRSGENLSLTVVRGFTVLDYGFPLAGRVQVAAGRYPLRDVEVSAGTSAKRPLSGSLQVSTLEIWDGRISSVTNALQWRSGVRLSLGATYARSKTELPGGAFVAHITGLRLGWTQSTRLAAAAYVQHNSLTRRWIVNFRLDLIHRPGSDLYVVINEERGTEAASRALVGRGLAVKLNYLIRL